MCLMFKLAGLYLAVCVVFKKELVGHVFKIREISYL